MTLEAKSLYNPFLTPEQNAQRGVVIVSEHGVKTEKLVSVMPKGRLGPAQPTEASGERVESKSDLIVKPQ